MNDKHDKLGRFAEKNENYEQKVQKTMGIENPKVEKPSSEFHYENGHVVIDSGSHKGETYDSLEDYKNTAKDEDAQLKKGIIELFKKSGFDEKDSLEHYETLSEEDKEKLKNYLISDTVDKSLEDFYNLDENKTRILKNYREFLHKVSPFFDKVSDDEIWKDMDLEMKKKYFGGK